MEPCPLCLSDNVSLYEDVQDRQFLRCQRCDLRFLEKNKIPSDEFQKNHYGQHQNTFEDSGYIRFLSQLSAPLIYELRRQGVGIKGLDFGCGHTPVLSQMLEQEGFFIEDFDKFFFPDRSVLKENSYDFIVMSEVIEHIKNPREELSQIISYLKPQGLLAIMTGVFQDDFDFKNWYYIKDLTHIRLYSKETFSWLETEFRLTSIFLKKNVIILKKSDE